MVVWILVCVALSWAGARILETLISRHVNHEKLPAGVSVVSDPSPSYGAPVSLKRRQRRTRALQEPAALEDSSGEVLADVTSALSNLGFRKRVASEAARKAVETLGADASLPTLIVEALRSGTGEKRV